ncbi:MAG TPA: SRPBCC domain-containing protein [Blastocatellia bacterium]|nr:SRPBCC domain-containing protein [Blastocatellia bacterium]
MQVNLKTEHPLTDVKSATGKTWEEWFSILDKRGGIAKGRRDIGNFLYVECKVDPWWSATINVQYEAAREAVEKDGRPKGYMICVTKTIAAPVDKAYEAWTTAEGLNEWFSKKNNAEVADGGSYSNADGDKGVFKRVRKNKDLRFTWENPAHTSPTQVDVVFQDKGKGKTGVMITHDRIQKREEADGLREGWAQALDRLKTLLEG